MEGSYDCSCVQLISRRILAIHWGQIHQLNEDRIAASMIYCAYELRRQFLALANILITYEIVTNEKLHLHRQRCIFIFTNKDYINIYVCNLHSSQNFTQPRLSMKTVEVHTPWKSICTVDIFDLIQCTVLHKILDWFVHQENVRNSLAICPSFILCQARFTSTDHNLSWQLDNSKQCDAYCSWKKITSLFSDFDWKCSLSYYTEMFLNKSFKITMGLSKLRER